MSEFIPAIPIGIVLAFTIGPVFFTVLETSISKGIKAAIFVDIGVVLSDVMFFVIAFFSTNSLLKSIEEIKMSTSVANNDEDISDDVLEFNENTIEGIDTKETLELLNRKMLKYAQNLQFEKAAILRDEIKKVEDSLK